MKRKILLLVALIVGISFEMFAVAVTFNVNMTGQTVSPNGVHVAGNFNDVNYDGITENAAYTNWNPSSIALVNQGNGIWKVTLNLVPARYEFKFINGNDWSGLEDVPAACQVEVNGNDNRFWTISGANPTASMTVCYESCAACGENTVRFRVDMTQESAGVNPAGVFVAVDFQGWNPASSQLIDPDGNGIFEGYFSIGTATSAQFKFINGNDWAFSESVPEACWVSGNREINLAEVNTVADVICFSGCGACQAPTPVLFRVDMTLQTVNANGPHVVGSFQGWNPGDPNTLMLDPDGDNIYEVILLLQPGTYQYKFVNGHAWADGYESIPSDCNVGGNRELVVAAEPVVEEYCYSKCTLDCIILGCNDPLACNFNVNDQNTSTCQYPGCNNPNACNFNPLAGCDNGSCILPGCTDNAACNYNPVTTCDNGSCTYPGCTNPIACNFNPSAGCDNGTCIFPGCTEINACNYNSLAGCNDGSCTYAGCTNSSACNFNSSAGCDDGSCHFTNTSCNDNNSNTILDSYNASCNCIGIQYTYGTIASSTNTICPEITSSSLAINNSPTGIVNYSLQWYFKTGNNAAPAGSNTSGWNMISGATASSLTVDAFTGTRTYACFVTPDVSYGISGSWMSGAKVLTYSSFAAQSIIGNPNITPFNAYNYIVNPIPGNTYNWSVTNGAIASGQGTNNVSIMWGQNGPYQLTLTESDGTCSGSSYLFAVNNNCSISVSAASATTNTFCAGTTLQLQAATSATGITYQWYLNGTLIPNETNQNISVSSGGNYQVSINQNGCTAVSNIVSINQLPSAIIPSILVEQANAGCAGGEATLTVSGGTYTNLLWNNGLTASSINVNASGDFSITAIDENGCAVSAGPVSVNFSILDPVPVCIVTVDQVTGKNNVVWEPVTSDLINSYVVLKETNVANEYAQIGTVAYGSNGIFEDVNSDPQIQANRYKLALIDTCGILSSTSNFHKTIHLTANQGLGSNVNLIWSNYEGFDFGSYSIYRGLSSSSLNLITTIASNLNSFTDVNPPAGEAYYMIEVAGVSCDPERTLVYSRSNILDASGIGIKEYDSSKIFLYPNPATTSINLRVNMSLIGEEYVVFDAIGKVIYTNKIQSINEFIQLEYFNNGNYFIKVNEVVKRFEVIK